MTGFSSLQDPDKKNKKGKYEYRYCPMEFRLKKFRDQHEKTTQLCSCLKKYKNPHKVDLAIIVNKDGFKPEEEEKKRTKPAAVNLD